MGITGGNIVKPASKRPAVCICIPTYNSALTVAESLKSILAQTYDNFVIRVSDNASTDNTVDVIEAAAGGRVTVYRQEKNCGAEANFTRCIELASGKYTAIFHADDLYEAAMLEKQVDFLEANPDVVAVFTRATMIDDHGVPFGVTGGFPGAEDQDLRVGLPELLKSTLLHHNFLVCPSVMVRTEIYKNDIKNWGGRGFRSASDVDTWFRLAGIGPIAILSEQLMRYRISTSQFSHRNRTRTERLDVFLVMEHYLAQPEIRALLNEADFRHYRWLERHERVALAMNNYGIGRVAQARLLMKNVFSWDTVRAAYSTRRGFVTFAAYMLLRVMLVFGANDFTTKLVRSAKNISWR